MQALKRHATQAETGSTHRYSVWKQKAETSWQKTRSDITWGVVHVSVYTNSFITYVHTHTHTHTYTHTHIIKVYTHMCSLQLPFMVQVGKSTTTKTSWSTGTPHTHMHTNTRTHTYTHTHIHTQHAQYAHAKYDIDTTLINTYTQPSGDHPYFTPFDGVDKKVILRKHYCLT